MSVSLTKKILLSVGALGAAASIAGLGTFATFTSTTSAEETTASGTVAIALGAGGSGDNRLTIGATGLVPGDSLARRVKLTNASGNQNLASITLSTSITTPGSLLDSDATNGLQMKIQKCAGALGWRETGTTAPFTYTCDSAVAGDNLGSRTSVLARRAIRGTDLALDSMSALTNGTTDDMVVTVDLPTAAGNTFQTLSSTITYAFTGTQRAGTDK